MDIYTLLREFADSWMLLFLFVTFAAVVAWVFRPGSTGIYKDVADIPFRHVDAPAPQAGDDTVVGSEEART